MKTGIRFILVCSMLAVLGGVNAQNATNSPYTRYGWGEISDQASANSKAMGGLAYGLRDKNHINFMNPASYTAVDSVTFIFDGGLSLQNDNLSDGTYKQNAKNSSLDYVAMEFRFGKKMAMSAGVLPYSSVGYSMSEYDSNVSSATVFSGTGGLHQFYAGLAYKAMPNLSVGANISYLWGNVNHIVEQAFPDNSAALTYTRSDEVDVKSYKLDLGAQYIHKINSRNIVIAGLTFSPGHNLNNDATITTQTGNSTYGYSAQVKDTVMKCDIPMSLGLGFTYIYNDQLTTGLDLSMQKWGSASFMGKEDALCDRLKIAAGVEYIPDPKGRSFLKLVKYRFGAYYSQPYYKIEGKRAANELGVTGGFCLPMPKSRSLVNLSAQYVRIQGKESMFMDENILRVCLGITFNERWFFKRKVD